MMRPLTEDQLSMLLSDAEVDGPVSGGDLDLSLEQLVAMHGLGVRGTEKVLTWAFNMGLVPCGHCFGSGALAGMSWGGAADEEYVFRRRFICTHCEGTGVAR